jgi:hypothetical protein
VNASVIQFLADSLALWQVDDGTVAAGTLPVVAVVRSAGCVVSIEQNTDADVPWRWFVRWRSADMREERSRPCASLTGMLNAVRRALGVERGNTVRVVANAAPPPSDPSLARTGQG